MRKQVLIIFLSVWTMGLFAQGKSYFNGMSISTGNMHPESANFGVALQNEMLQVRQFDSLVKYDVVYELKNTAASFSTVNVSIPLNIYFNEFAYGKRAPLLDELANITTFSDLFTVQDRALDMREQIRQNFQQRLFIRKYISIENLKAMGIFVDVFRNNTRVNIKKILCEVKFEDATPLLLSKNTEVLAMEFKLMFDINMQPDEMTNILTFLTLPTMTAGIDKKETYTSYQMGYEKNWSGSMNGLYIEHDLFSATPILPTKMNNFTTQISGDRDQVIIFKNVTPGIDDRIGFYHISDQANCNSGAMYDEQLIIPSAVKNITSSSWVKTDVDLPKRAFYNTPMVAYSDSIGAYQTGNPTGIDCIDKNLTTTDYSNGSIYNYVSMSCKNNQPAINLKESGNAIYAFDVADHKLDDSVYTNVENLARQTCWCEGAAGIGEKEYVEFEITQPSRAIKIMNGNLMTRKIFDESTKTDIILITSLDGHILTKSENKPEYRSSIIDLPILNVYELNMPAGKYRLTLDAVDKKGTPVTCISSITFDFVVNDEWYAHATAMLSSFFGKQN